MVCFFKDGWANWGCHEKIALNDGASVASRKRGLEKFRLDDSVRTTLPIAIGTLTRPKKSLQFNCCF